MHCFQHQKLPAKPFAAWEDRSTFPQVMTVWGFWFLIMIARGQECSKPPMFRNSAFYIKCKGEKNPHVIVVQVRGCGGLWRFLTGVSVSDHDWEGSRMSQTTYSLKFSFLHRVKGTKNPHVLKVLVWSCEHSQLWFWFLIMIGRGQECPEQHIIQNSAFYIE